MTHVDIVSDHVGAAESPLSIAVDPITSIKSAVAIRDQILTRRVIEGLIADGHTIVILDGQVLKLDKWLEKHPGGRLPLLQMIGVDATTEIKA